MAPEEANGKRKAEESGEGEAAGKQPRVGAIKEPSFIKPYEKPPRLGSAFSSLPDAKPADSETSLQLAWAVKHLDVECARHHLATWPHGANLLDGEDNTLFHLAAIESAKYAANPKDAEKMFKLLLAHGWEVVDLKNKNGLRAEVVAQQADPSAPPRQLLVARSRDFHETPRTKNPLALVGENSPQPDKWQYMLHDEQRRSFAGAHLGAIPKETCVEWMNTAVEKGAWSGSPEVPRRVAWYTDESLSDLPYQYSGLMYLPTVFPPWMQEIRKRVCELCGVAAEDFPNSCNVNIYTDHTAEVGWHSDDEVMFQSLTNDTRIISFSLGSARPFNWRLQGTTETVGSVPLGDGDIMTMEGRFQKHYKHSVLASDTPCGARINFTFRWVRVKAHAEDAKTRATA